MLTSIDHNSHPGMGEDVYSGKTLQPHSIHLKTVNTIIITAELIIVLLKALSTLDDTV